MRLWLTHEEDCIQRGAAGQEESRIRSIYPRCWGLALYLKSEFGVYFPRMHIRGKPPLLPLLRLN